MRGFTTQLVRYLSTVANHRTDGDLLAGFLTRKAEADFAELVRRHGPMVWGVCRRALPDRSDAEDAFQTAFMVLVQRGNRLVTFPSIGPWLHRVAVWTARNVRRRNARQLAKRVTLPEQLTSRTANVDLSLDLDAALLSLPEKFRSSIVLCHLLGFSRADAAAQLGCAERTLSSWLSRGLTQLRHKLRGIDPMKALGIAAVAVPVGLSDSVVRAAISLQTAAVAASVLSSTISQLVEGVIHMFWVKKATAATVALFAVFAFGVGIGVSTHQLSPASGGEDKVAGPQPVANAEYAADPDIDATIAELEKRIAVAPNQLDLLTLQALKAQKAKKIQAVQASRALKDLKDKLESQEVQIDENVNEMTLGELLTLLSKKYDITFVIMEEAFKAEKITNIKEKKLQVGSTMKKLNGLKLNVFLDLILTSVGATFIVRPDYIEITTFEKRLEEKVTRVFPEDAVSPLGYYPPAQALVIRGASRDHPEDTDKRLEDLKVQLAKAQAEAERAQAEALVAQAQYARKSEALKERILVIKTSIVMLQNEKEKQKTPDAKGPTAGKASGAYLQLTIGTKDAMWPFQVTEFGSDGKSIGTIAFTNAEVFGRYLARTMKDATGPKELRITARADMPYDLLISTVEMCKAAGFKDVVIARKENNGTVADSVSDRQKEKALLEERRALVEQLRLQTLEEIKRDPIFNELEAAVTRARKALMDAEAVFLPDSPQLLKIRRDLKAAEEKRDQYHSEARARAESLLKDEPLKLKELIELQKLQRKLEDQRKQKEGNAPLKP
ncbi:MAG TPA: sigma-70 family RNA polymerase sigma factor [Gemmata sp.]|jgi:RNA polymerase sigma factor (sigma-70 family)|nr:sigma-70 family RNA polymerase sigma factor [Gemmata sp.]